MLARHGFEGGKKDARGEGSIEEDMGEEDAGKTIDGEARQAEGSEAVIDEAGPAINRRHGEDADDRRNSRGDAEKSEESAPAPDMPPRKGKRQKGAEAKR